MSEKSLDDIRKKLWQGEIPVCFCLAVDDLASIAEEPETCCIMIPRNSYFPLHLDRLQRYLTPYVRPEIRDQEYWLETKDKKIKWHLPVGVLYDTFYGLESQGSPWNITIHYSNFPEKELLHCKSLECVKSNYMSAVKEADALKHGSTVINAMQKAEHDMLWSGLKMRSFDEFWAINKRLMNCENDETFRYLPIRIHSNDKSHTQKLVQGGDDQVTVENILDISNVQTENVTVYTQGIELPLTASVQQLTVSLSYPDGFLHLCIKPLKN